MFRREDKSPKGGGPDRCLLGARDSHAREPLRRRSAGSTAKGQEYDAYADPWCAVSLMEGSRCLFGFAHQHPGTGGLSWLRSSELIELDPGAGQARTASGRRYSLGREFFTSDLRAEGEEATVAFNALIGSQAEGSVDVPYPSETDIRWLVTCKVARHLGLSPPDRTGVGIDRFISFNLVRYLALRATGDRA